MIYSDIRYIREESFNFSDRWKWNSQFMDRYIEDALELRICIALQTGPRNELELMVDVIRGAS